LVRPGCRFGLVLDFPGALPFGLGHAGLVGDDLDPDLYADAARGFHPDSSVACGLLGFDFADGSLVFAFEFGSDMVALHFVSTDIGANNVYLIASLSKGMATGVRGQATSSTFRRQGRQHGATRNHGIK
jgi:hypothetical protein